ncbi:MAG TPA: class II aldolase/adducin family protein [Candidatus Omnitrophota bacterium]|nr:class II aldolase/adducin family protein [Candidatus Omnitrophota bacterium]
MSGEAEKGIAPKFKTIFAGTDPAKGPEVDRLKYWSRKFIDEGLMPEYPGGCFGNLSCRTAGNKFVITASGMKAPDDDGSFCAVEAVDADKFEVTVKGKKAPSSETVLHYKIYRARPEVNAIFHGHCQTILDRAGSLGVPVTEKGSPYGTAELAEEALKALGKGDFVILKGHGFVSVGHSADEAGSRALEYLERSR